MRGRRLIAFASRPSSGEGRSRPGCRWALWVALAAAGCTSLPRLAEEGRWDEVVARAAKRRRPPRGNAARAHARALEHLGHIDHARAVLLLDHRHGGDVRSLLQLAALEEQHGLEGIAAVHYGRAIDLDIQLAKSDPEACRAMRDRASAFAAQGAGRAAEADLRRAGEVCPPPHGPDAEKLQALAERVEAAAQAEAEARVRASRCAAPDCAEIDAAARTAALRKAIAEADAAGPLPLRTAAAELGVGLSAEQIATLLAADLRGELGAAIVRDDEIRGWIAGQTWSDLAPVVMSRDAAEASYLQLRLSAVCSDLPVAPRRAGAPAEDDVWSARALEEAKDSAWRVLAWQGDLASTELALGARWRPAPRDPSVAPSAAVAPGAAVAPVSSPETGVPASAPETPAAAPAPSIDVPAPSHWAARVEPDPVALPALLAVARLRHTAKRRDEALEITRYVLARAATTRTVDPAVATEAAWHLAWGRPWQALAVADAVAGPRSDAVASAAATAILLTRAFCGGPCHEDDDLETVTRVMGEAWVADRRAGLQRRALRAEVAMIDAPGRGRACAHLSELLAPDAEGPVAEAVAAALRDRSSPAALGAYARAFESDPTLACDARWIMGPWAAASGSTTADAVLDRLAHGGQIDAPRTLAAQAQVAMIAGNALQAEQLATAAAAASTEPRAEWIETARFADLTGQRDLELHAGRQALLHTPALHDRALARALVLERLHDLARESADRTTAAGREAFVPRLREHLQQLAPAQRWDEREALAEALAEAEWADDTVRGRLRSILWPTQELLDAHPIGRRRLAHEAPSVAPSGFDAAALALWVAAGGSLSAPTRTFADPAGLGAVRRAASRHAEPWTERWRLAIGLSVFGTANDRTEALAALLEMSEGPARAAILDLLVATPAAIEPTAGIEPDALGAPTRAAPIVASEAALARLVFGLPASAWPEVPVLPEVPQASETEASR